MDVLYARPSKHLAENALSTLPSSTATCMNASCGKNHARGLAGKERRPAHLDAGLARAHVAAAQPQLPHAREGELAQVALLDAAGDEGHGDVALDAVHAHPRRHQRQQPRHLRQA